MRSTFKLDIWPASFPDRRHGSNENFRSNLSSPPLPKRLPTMPGSSCSAMKHTYTHRQLEILKHNKRRSIRKDRFEVKTINVVSQV